ncbi:hypothetical protein PMAYCL1PPCAC_01580, partial [Pristionchus mayeri]
TEMDEVKHPDPDAVRMFVGQVPFCYSESECTELFELYGPVYKVEVLRDNETQQGKGCCFVTFFHRADAFAALSALHDKKILPGVPHPIQMRPASYLINHWNTFVMRRLFVGTISKNMEEEDLKRMFSPFGKIEECVVIREHGRISKGCGFVTFYSPSCAEKAKKTMDDSMTMEGCSKNIVVKFAHNQGEIMYEARNGIGSMMGPPMPFPGILPAAPCQLLRQNNNLGLPLQNPQGMMGTGIGRGMIGGRIGLSDILPMKGNASALHPSLLAAKQQILQQQMLQRQKLIDSLLFLKQQQAAVARESAKLGINGGLHPPLSPSPMMRQQQQQWLQQCQLPPLKLQQPPMPLQQPPLQPPFPQMGMNSIQQISPPTSVADLFARKPQPLLQLQGLKPAGKHARPASRVIPPLIDGIRSFVPSAAVAGKPQFESTGPDGCNLFVYHLPQSFSDADLLHSFAPFGKILSATVYLDLLTGITKGFGFVSYDNSRSAAAAIAAMNGREIRGKKLRVTLKTSRGSTHPYHR